jgi:hypothetical protein
MRLRNSRLEVRGSRFEARGSRLEARGSRFDVRGSRLEVGRFEGSAVYSLLPDLVDAAGVEESLDVSLDDDVSEEDDEEEPVLPASEPDFFA